MRELIGSPIGAAAAIAVSAAIIAVAAIIILAQRQHRLNAIGREGERMVSDILASLPADRYICLNNLLLPLGSRGAQIDHTVISEHGIFVLEVKNYAGLIRGDECADYFTQYRGGSKRRFLNPLRQNDSHIAALMRLTGLPRGCFISVGVFTSRPKLKIRKHLHLPGRRSEYIVRARKLRRLIRRVDAPEAVGYDIPRLADLIEAASLDSIGERRRHIRGA